MAFQRIRNAVKQYSVHAEALEKIHVELSDWLVMTEEVREFKLKAARAVK